MVMPDPLKQLEAGVLTFVQHQVEQHGGHPFPFEQRHRLGCGRGGRRPVAKVVQVDGQLLLHRGLVLDHQHRRTQHVGGPVDLQPRR